MGSSHSFPPHNSAPEEQAILPLFFISAQNKVLESRHFLTPPNYCAAPLLISLFFKCSDAKYRQKLAEAQLYSVEVLATTPNIATAAAYSSLAAFHASTMGSGGGLGIGGTIDPASLLPGASASSGSSASSSSVSASSASGKMGAGGLQPNQVCVR